MHKKKVDEPYEAVVSVDNANGNRKAWPNAKGNEGVTVGITEAAKVGADEPDEGTGPEASVRVGKVRKAGNAGKYRKSLNLGSAPVDASAAMDQGCDGETDDKQWALKPVSVYITRPHLQKLEERILMDGWPSMNGLLSYLVAERKVVKRKEDGTLDRLMHMLGPINDVLDAMVLGVREICTVRDQFIWTEQQWACWEDIETRFRALETALPLLIQLTEKLGAVWLQE